MILFITTFSVSIFILCTGDLKDDDKSDETVITPSSNSNHLLQVKGTIRINCGTDITVISGQDVQVKCLSRGKT